MNNLKVLLNENKVDQVKKILEKLIKLYKSNLIIDHIYVEEMINKKYKENSEANKGK